jgi:hypothetical protein
MALTPQSFAAAAKKKAEKAQAKVRHAEAELNAANHELKDALPTQNMQELEAAVERTTAAEREVHEAAEELDAVNALLEQSASPSSGGGTPGSSGASGQGVDSLLPHLRRTR